VPGLKVGIVGSGIVGLSHAWMAAEQGHSVTVFERSAQASGASIRNFGMVWPIGQPPGELHRLALRSRERWLQLSTRADIWSDACGSVHLAHREDEWNVLREFHVAGSKMGYECQLLTPDETIVRTLAANPSRLCGGLFSPTEVCVNARAAIRQIPRWLASQFGVTFEFQTAITQVDSTSARTNDGRSWNFDRIIVCGGSDFETLFPDVLEQSGLQRCKLQMLKTCPQPHQWRLGPMLASGLTLRHYKSFEICPSLDRLKRRIALETPELDRFGIHVMASQTPDGSLILGDSHEYDDTIEPFDKAEIDELILRELKSIIQLPDWTTAETWHGIYAKHPGLPIFAAEPIPNVFVRTGTGGSGMTLAFGLAERDWEQWT
jgi:D-hydroxyproline dehydrogenase subunit beta